MSSLTNAGSMQGDYEPAEIEIAMSMATMMFMVADDDDVDWENTKHFLLIGFLGMFVGAIVFYYLSMNKKEKKLHETLMFLVAVTSAAAYYLMWSGFGVVKKTDSAGKERLVFFAHFIERLLTTPLLLYSICDLTNAAKGETVMILGLDMLMVASSTIGATQLRPWKWFWWTVGIAFFVLLALQVWSLYSKAKESGNSYAAGLQVLVMILLVSFIVYPTVWVLGEEGLQAISINMESGLYVLVDLVSKIVFGLYLLFAVLGSEEQDSEGAEKTSLV
ncbi:hypothetical protein GUITHDRAFT_106708 [Guillardia theta CCMP2712]|uniref:Rhodopsin n=2 Tax=Guillardia theta TaxID=55529 RepID=L1JGN9_GUITC|nr:hypothetical protein GUITHDRAFT_106708 [Guillardia theta CCMP2712]EKX47260.1 hypothetical protein GUITHDRAFT_106708 [Guillardia theta CCMP2712]|eukprot:XP_005834240.1 hypothetical protein GUITHDRAFT_106708 [Guillardia theta CCMP2712]